MNQPIVIGSVGRRRQANDEDVLFLVSQVDRQIQADKSDYSTRSLLACGRRLGQSYPNSILQNLTCYAKFVDAEPIHVYPEYQVVWRWRASVKFMEGRTVPDLTNLPSVHKWIVDDMLVCPLQCVVDDFPR